MRFITRPAPTIFMASAVAASVLTACAAESDAPVTEPSPNQGILAGTLETRVVRPTLTLRNTTEFVVGYMVVDKDQMVVALYPPCGDRCPQLTQGESVVVNFSEIGGYTPASREAIVMWWKYTRSADGTLRPEGGVQTANVRLD